MKRILLTLLMLLAGLSLARAAAPNTWVQDLRAAQAALAAGDYATAYRLYLKKGDRNPLAQFTLGMFHRNGWGRPADPSRACHWFEQAAQKHIPTAEHFWGDCLAEGIGRTPDVHAALDWYAQAAADGHLISLCSAGDYYIQGKGVAQDVARGIAMCTQAAQASSPPAMLKLARYYEDGIYVRQDPAAARYWYQQAAALHTAEAQYHLGLMLAQGEGGAVDVNNALFWLETAASEGYVPAYLPTAKLYANAPVQEQTGALAPEYLAKIYLWSAAAMARGTEPEQRAEAEKLEQQVLLVMPATWRPKLDQEVAEHVAKYSHSQ